jgi:hypothetical protein
MKITGHAGARWVEDKSAIVLYPLASDIPLVKKLFAAKARREEKDGSTVYPEYTLEVGARGHTWKQQRAVWALITIIYQAMHGVKPDNDEKYELYLDCLDLYAEKTPNRFTGALRAVHLSESDVMQCAGFITHLMQVIIEYCDLDMSDENGKRLNLDADVRTVFYRWQEWRGEQSMDPLDYDDDWNLLSLQEWRKKHLVSDASGVGGALEAAHIVSRGANKPMIEDVRNLIMLAPEEHRFQHQYGWDKFLAQYPHLKGRVLRARSLASNVWR